MGKLIKTVMINIGTWYTSKRHRYNDTLPKSSYPWIYIYIYIHGYIYPWIYI